MEGDECSGSPSSGTLLTDGKQDRTGWGGFFVSLIWVF